VPHWVAIDAGHGGVDLGTRHFDADGHMDVHESEVNLALALQLRDILTARGYYVFMTRDGDYRVNKDEVDLLGDGEFTSSDEVQARVDLLNTTEAELLLSIHQNAYWPNGVPDQSVGGPATYYCADRPFADESARFAGLVQDKIVAAIRGLGYDCDDRGVEDDLAIQQPGKPGTHLILLGPVSERIVRASKMPGALNETLFLSNDIEAALLQDSLAQQAMATAYADAIDAYFAGESAPPREE
jgi:N-acetylmuramoyl-L-alanine amidase